MQTIKSYSVGNGFATADSTRAIKRAIDTAKKNKAAQTVICDGKVYAYAFPSGSHLIAN